MKFLCFVITGVSAFHLQKTAPSQHRPLFSAVSQYVDASEYAARDISTMDQWAASCGVQRVDGFQLTTDQYEGVNNVFAMTNQDIPANTPVLCVPNTLVLSSNQAQQQFGKLWNAEKILESLNAKDELPHFYLMLQILVEYEKGEGSQFMPWLNSLPRYYQNGASMTSFCYDCLPPLASKLAMKERTNFNALQSAIKQVPFLSDYTKENCAKWAFQIAYTRSWKNNRNGDLCLAPLADFFNHGSAETEIEIQYDVEGNCYAMSTRDIPAGSPLRMSYGDPTNPSFLFARYGFLDESAPATFCKIMIPHENKELKEMGYAPHKMLFYKDTGEASEEVWDVLLYQILSSSNVSKRRQFYEAHKRGDLQTKQAFQQQYYQYTAAKLLEHIDTFIYELDKLSQKSYGKDPNEHPRLPLILKHNEFVRNTFLAVRARYF